MTEHEAAGTLAVAGGALAQAGQSGARRARAAARRPGRTARAAPSRSRSTPITRPTSCARAANRSAAWPGASTATASACRASCKLLKKYDVPATFYVPAVAALLHPDEQRQVIAEGHEIGIHSWIHELNSVLSYEAESDMHDARRRHAGEDHRRAPGRRRAPPSWDFSPHTLRITKEMGLLYDSSLMADEDCYELVLDGEPTGVVELPVEWMRDDAVYFMMHRFQSLRPQMPPRPCSTSSAASSTRPTRKAASARSPCIRTSSATARASGSSRS